MVSPSFVRAGFWFAVLSGLGTAIVALKEGADVTQTTIGVVSGLIALRVICEVCILFFRMNETLTEVSRTLEIISSNTAVSTVGSAEPELEVSS